MSERAHECGSAYTISTLLWWKPSSACLFCRLQCSCGLQRNGIFRWMRVKTGKRQRWPEKKNPQWISCSVSNFIREQKHQADADDTFPVSRRHRPYLNSRRNKKRGERVDAITTGAAGPTPMTTIKQITIFDDELSTIDWGDGKFRRQQFMVCYTGDHQKWEKYGQRPCDEAHAGGCPKPLA